MTNHHWLGLSKSAIKSTLQRMGIDTHTTEFAHWLYVPNLGLLFNFE